MATWDDVRRIALALPDTDEQLSRGIAQWRVREKGFVWERPLRRSDLEALGAAAPAGPILAARVADVGVKQALIADDPASTSPPALRGLPGHPDPAEPDRRDRARRGDRRSLARRAPKRLAKEYLDKS